MEWRRTVELSEGMVQRANEPECCGKESKVGAKDMSGIEMRCKGIALEARMSNGIARHRLEWTRKGNEVRRIDTQVRSEEGRAPKSKNKNEKEKATCRKSK